MIFLDSSTRLAGRILWWRWELWEIGGGAGVEWFVGDRCIDMPDWSPLWWIVNWRIAKDKEAEG